MCLKADSHRSVNTEAPVNYLIAGVSMGHLVLQKYKGKFINRALSAVRSPTPDTFKEIPCLQHQLPHGV